MNFINPFKILALGAIVLTQVTPTFSVILYDGNICDSQGFGKNFTGLIVQYQASMEVPPQNHARITRCLEGKKRAYDAFAPVKYDEEIAWGKKICTGQKNQKSVCYVLARREVTSHHKLSIFPPGEWVGGVFMCPGSLPDDGKVCHNDNAVPLWPLVSTNMSHYKEVVRTTQIIRVPYLISYNMDDKKANIYTPSVDIPANWAEFIDVTEDYFGSNTDRSLNRVVWDLTLGSIRIALKSFHHIALFRSTATFVDKGDEEGARRSAQDLNPKVTFEEHPEAFSPAPGEEYLEDDYEQVQKRDTSYTKRPNNLKRQTLQTGGSTDSIQRSDYDKEIAKLSAENYMRYLYSSDYDNLEYGLKLIDYAGSEPFPRDNIFVDTQGFRSSSIPIDLGHLVQLSVELPTYVFTYILNTLYTANSLAKGELLGHAIFQHPSLLLNPSKVLDAINQRRLPVKKVALGSHKKHNYQETNSSIEYNR